MREGREPDPVRRYQIGLRSAKLALRRLGRTIVDGREAHDFAMDRVFSDQWGRRRVYFDVIDAYRRERGRSKRRKFVPLPYGLSTRDPPFNPDWKDAWSFSPAEDRVSVLLAAGLSKTEASKWLGVSQAAISSALRGMRRRNGDLHA